MNIKSARMKIEKDRENSNIESQEVDGNHFLKSSNLKFNSSGFKSDKVRSSRKIVSFQNMNENPVKILDLKSYRVESSPINHFLPTNDLMLELFFHEENAKHFEYLKISS